MVAAMAAVVVCVTDRERVPLRLILARRDAVQYVDASKKRMSGRVSVIMAPEGGLLT
jgi:hypothetical protein